MIELGETIGFVFFPPAFYQRWINGNAPVEKAEEG